MSKAFDEAFELITRNPLPDDIIELLDDLGELIDADEREDFSWFYEAASLKTRLVDEGE